MCLQYTSGISQYTLRTPTLNTYGYTYSNIHMDTHSCFIHTMHRIMHKHRYNKHTRMHKAKESDKHSKTEVYSSFWCYVFHLFAPILPSFSYLPPSLSLSHFFTISLACSFAVRSLSGRFCLAVLRTHVPRRKDRDKTDGWATEIDSICSKLLSVPVLPFCQWCCHI